MVVVATLALLLPLGAAGVAAWTPVGPGERSLAASVLLFALTEAPVVLVLGAATGLLLVRRATEVGRRPATAGVAGLLGLVGILAGVFLHVVVRGRLAGSPDVPPFALVFQVDDFARAAPLLPVTMLLASLAGPIAALKVGSGGALAGLAVGLVAGLGAGWAVLPTSALASLIGGGAVYVALGLALLVVALLAARARSV